VTTVPLDASNTGTLGAAGSATVKIGPNRVGQVWTVRGVAVFCDTQDPMPRAYLYRGPVVPSGLLSATYTGAQNSTDLSDITLRFGEFLSAVWLLGAPGAIVTVTAYGDVSTVR
jgi:hypothetical protein